MKRQVKRFEVSRLGVLKRFRSNTNLSAQVKGRIENHLQRLKKSPLSIAGAFAGPPLDVRRQDLFTRRLLSTKDKRKAWAKT
jgi:hypothetical protein